MHVVQNGLRISEPEEIPICANLTYATDTVDISKQVKKNSVTMVF